MKLNILFPPDAMHKNMWNIPFTPTVCSLSWLGVIGYLLCCLSFTDNLLLNGRMIVSSKN